MLYCITIEQVDNIYRWHTDVSTYVLKDGEGVPFGLFYLDPYARADKRSGAWMDECINRRHTAHGLQQPVPSLTCNFTPPLPGKQALLTHDVGVPTFTELGHGFNPLLNHVY